MRACIAAGALLCHPVTFFPFPPSSRFGMAIGDRVAGVMVGVLSLSTFVGMLTLSQARKRSGAKEERPSWLPEGAANPRTIVGEDVQAALDRLGR